MLLSLYGAAVFASSAILMILEIAAARLVAPYVGISLYSWTSIIGVVLAGLSLGNWLGGRWADRGGGAPAVGLARLGAALASLAVPLLLTLVAPAVRDGSLGLLAATFSLVAALFFAPAACLGVVTPLLTSLALAADPRRGHVVGTLHALAALGSIAGTFAAGFWLVQYLGTRTLLLTVSAALALLGLPFLRRRLGAAAVSGVLAVGVVLITGARNGFANPCQHESQYYCLRVEDFSDEVPFGEARGLVIDHLLHGINHAAEPGMLVSSYLHLADELVIGYLGEGARTARLFFSGGGGYTHPRAVRALTPSAEVTVAEIDPAVTRFAREHMYLDTSGMRVLHTDARVALTRLAGERFDAVVADTYQDVAIPYHLTTVEYARLVESRLVPGGVYVLNVLDAYPAPALVRSMVATLREVFDEVHVWLETVPRAPERVTWVISATDAGAPPPVVRAQRGFEREWQRVTEAVMAPGSDAGEPLVLRDDFVPVERLVSRLLLTDLGR